jgi:hypothetical protein
MGTAARMSTSLEALAALAAHVRVESEELDADSRVRELLRAISAEVLGGDVNTGGPEAAAVVGMTRTLLAQSAELIAEPARAPGWEHVDALRPGGWLLPGTYAGPPDHLSQLLIDLRTVRSGGHAWQSDELVAEISRNGFENAREAERTWDAPVRLFAGRQPT